jgi:pimeloyl-ACP methyl ester carboxylesterase
MGGTRRAVEAAARRPRFAETRMHRPTLFRMPRLPRYAHELAQRSAASAPSTRSLVTAAVAATIALGAAAIAVRALARAADHRHPPTGGFVEVDGVRLHYLERGHGPALVLLHGNGSMLAELELSGLIDVASRHYRVIAFDRPGFGDSTPAPLHARSAQAEAKLIASALTILGVDQATVLGHSGGTLVALALALDHPQRVRGLVVVSGHYFPALRPDTWLMSAPAWPVIGALLRHTISPLASRLLWPLLVRRAFGPPATPADIASLPKWKFLRPSRLQATAAASAAVVRETKAMSRRYGELRMPVMILAGASDRIVAPRQGERLHDAIRHSELVVVPRAGHMLHHFAPRRVLAAVHRVTAPDRTLDERPIDRMGDFPPVTAGLA